jgi:putative hydrolase of the HAD superfamily
MSRWYLCNMVRTTKYHHIFFDLDETLWDFKRNSLETIHELIDRHQLEDRGIKKENFIRRYHHHNDIYWDLYRKGEISREQLRTVRWKTTLGEFEIEDEALVKNLSEQYLQLLPNKKNLYSDAIAILDYLKPKYSLHIITNGFEEVQLQKIITSGIASYFTHIITSERAGTQKPNKEIFQYALAISNCTVGESIFIGDSIEADIKGAKAVGMDHVLFNPEKIPHTESLIYEISSLTELKMIL